MTSAQWIDEFQATKKKRREMAEKEEQRSERKAALDVKDALERNL